jgi:hypothetical protein
MVLEMIAEMEATSEACQRAKIIAAGIVPIGKGLALAVAVRREPSKRESLQGQSNHWQAVKQHDSSHRDIEDEQGEPTTLCTKMIERQSK